MFDDDASFVQQKPSTNIVKFYRQYVEKFKEHRDYILIICPGQSKTEVRRPVQEIDKMNYAVEWRQYLEGKENAINGTALEMMGLDKSLIDMLKVLYVHTVEHLAGLSDLSLQKIMGGNELRSKAQAFLSKNTTEVVELRAQLADMQTTVAALEEKLQQLATTPATKRDQKGRFKPKPEGADSVTTDDHSKRL